MPSPQIVDAVGVWGRTPTDDRSPLHVPMIASGTVTSGDLVVCVSNSTGVVRSATTGDALPLVVGVAAQTKTSTQSVDIIIHGPVYGVKKDNTVGVTAGDKVGLSAAVAASVLSISAATAVTQLKDTGNVIGIALATYSAASATADIFFVKY